MFPETRDLRGTFLRLPQRVKTRYRENGLIGGGELENSKRGGVLMLIQLFGYCPVYQYRRDTKSHTHT